jgi:Ran GTPase-activating protein (RanGAP) involved in mRNA processing and transport
MYAIIILSCLLLLSGCKKKEEPLPTGTPAAPPAPAAKETGGKTQLSKAMSIHQEFVKAFSLSKGDTLDAVRERMDLADKARVSCMLLRPDIQDPATTDFLIRFTDKLQQYLDLSKKHVTTLEEVMGLYASGKEIENGLAKLPEKDKAQATTKLNSIIERHNKLAQGPLEQERTELRSLGNELMSLK